jgi:carboxyl-terminal processing protease
MYLKKILFFNIPFLFFWLFFSLNIFSNNDLEVKAEYDGLISEIFQILNEDHFKKNTQVTEKKVLTNFLLNLDKEKVIFTEKESNSFLSKFKNLFNLKQVFDIYLSYSNRSLELINSQKLIVESLKNTADLNSIYFIDKNRENKDSFNSLEEIKNYHSLLIKNEFISVLLSNDDFVSTKRKILKRLDNRIKSLNRIKSDDIFSLYTNSITSLYDPHTNYLSPKSQEDFEINMSLSLEGIGAILSIEDGITKIVRLIPGGPADKSGLLKVNDKIVGVASLPEKDLEDVRDWRIDEVVRLIRGPKNTRVRLEIIPNSSPDDVLGKVI